MEEIFHLMKLYKDITDAEESVKLFRLLIRYLLRAAKYVQKEQIEYSATKELSEWRDDYMSIADVLKKEGYKEGLKEGKEALLWKLILTKFPTIDKSYYKKLSELDSDVFEILASELLIMKDSKELEKYFLSR